MSEKNRCFVISPIGEPESEVRKRADMVFNHIIQPAVEQQGYQAVRADNISEPGNITSQVIEYVVESDLVIADLTGSNPNVFYELAIRHAYRKPLIQMIEEGQTIPFDVASDRAIFFSTDDIAKAEEAKEAIMSQINTIEEFDESDIENPVVLAENIRGLRESSKKEDRDLADVMEDLSLLNNKIDSIRNILEEGEAFSQKVNTNFSDIEDKLNLLTKMAHDIDQSTDELLSHDIDDDYEPFVENIHNDTKKMLHALREIEESLISTKINNKSIMAYSKQFDED